MEVNKQVPSQEKPQAPLPVAQVKIAPDVSAQLLDELKSLEQQCFLLRINPKQCSAYLEKMGQLSKLMKKEDIQKKLFPEGVYEKNFWLNHGLCRQDYAEAQIQKSDKLFMRYSRTTERDTNKQTALTLSSYNEKTGQYVHKAILPDELRSGKIEEFQFPYDKFIAP